MWDHLMEGRARPFLVLVVHLFFCFAKTSSASVCDKCSLESFFFHHGLVQI
jgi:hypothetical protein